jgi:AraC-like DNA-binding protein
MFRLIRAHGPAAAPAQVSFQYPAPPYHLEYTQVFERPPRFDQAFTGIVFDRALLDRASPHRDHATHRALVAVAEGELARITRQTPCFRRATEYLVSRGAASEVRMEEVARSLGMSVRSLRRRLVAEGRTYRAVEQDAHAIVAQQHLRSPQLSIEETALKMGFAHPSAFYRAFKRWTGMTPLEFREQAETTHKAAP